MPTLHELGQASEIALNKYKEKYESFPKKTMADGSVAPEIPADQFKTLSDMMTEVETTTKAFNDARQLDDRTKAAFAQGERNAEPQRGGAPDGGGTTVQKSLGDLFLESKAFKGKDAHGVKFHKDQEVKLDVDTKTLMTTGQGYAPQTVRSGRVVLSAQRPPTLADAIPSGTIGQVANKYMRETVFTNNAAETAEGGQMPEAALQLVEVTDPVQKIAVFLPVTDEQLEDIDGIRSYIDNRMELMIAQRLDYQLANGNGTSPNLLGYLNVAGIQVQARESDPAFDAWLKLITKLQSAPGYCNPSALWMSPVDWQNLLLTRTSTDLYILGNPGDAEARKSLWGLPVVASPAMPTGTGAAADFLAFTELLYYRGIEMMVTNSNNDDFTKGRQCIRATIRVVNSLYRNTAFGELTGL